MEHSEQDPMEKQDMGDDVETSNTVVNGFLLTRGGTHSDW